MNQTITVPPVTGQTKFAALWRKVGGEISVAPDKFAAANVTVSQTPSYQGQSGQQATQPAQTSCYLTGRYLVCNGQIVGVIEGNGGNGETGN